LPTLKGRRKPCPISKKGWKNEENGMSDLKNQGCPVSNMKKRNDMEIGDAPQKWKTIGSLEVPVPS